MSEAVQLLNELDETISSEEQHIVIDDDRFITVPENLKRIGVQFDHNIETVTFDCPRHWDEHDLSTMNIYINYLRSDRTYGKFKATDIIVDAENSEVIHFNWTISKNVTLSPGKIVFLVCAKTVDEEGNEQTHWNSERCEDCYISEGLELDEYSEDLRPDIIELWYKQVLNAIDDVVSIKSIEQTTTSTLDKGVNVITVTLTNGQTASFQVMNGSRGSAGSGSAESDWVDKTEDFLAQNEFLSENDYLRALGPGKWRISNRGCRFSIVTEDCEGMRWRFEEELGDDGAYYESIYANNKLVYDIDSQSGTLRFENRNVLTDHDIPFPDASNAGQALGVNEKGKAYWTDEFVNRSTLTESLGNPTPAKAGYIPMVSAYGNLELTELVNAEEVGY